MIRWIPYAFVRVVIFFMAGICLGIYFPDVLSLFAAHLLFSILILIYVIGAILIYRGKILDDYREIKSSIGFVGLATIFLAGYLNLVLHTESRREDHLIHQQQTPDFYKVIITNATAEKANSWKAEAAIQAVRTEGSWKECRAKIILYFQKKDFPIPYKYGDVFLIKGSPQLVKPPANPEEFDYKRFLSFKNIHHQHFLHKTDVHWIENDPPNKVMAYAFICRSWAENVLKKYISGIREQGVIIALVLGVTDGLDNELLNAYAATGAMHVLAVSGLHVGIIYWLLLLIFKPLNKTTTGKWMLAFVSIFVLWSYAFITGLSPSVLRAVTMFSFVALARPAQFKTNIYNTLAASAFVILWYQPFLIMSVGFQLSYMAVLGIVYLHPPLYRTWEPDSYLVNKVWEITSMSLAAQLATFALGLLYFHQFPNYFIFSNLLVIPGSTLILILGLALLAFNFVPFIAVIFGHVITWLIKAMNLIVFYVEALPYSLVENIYIDTFQCWLLLFLISGLILLVKYKQLNYLIASACFVVLFSVSQWIHFESQVMKQRLTIYQVRGHQAIDLIDRGHVYFFMDSALLADHQNIRFHIKPNRLQCGVSEVSNGEVAGLLKKNSGCNLICWKDKRLLLINEVNFKLPDSCRVDYLVIGNNAVSNLALIKHLHVEQLILDGSNSFYFADKILKQATEQHIAVHSILHQGSFNVTL